MVHIGFSFQCCHHTKKRKNKRQQPKQYQCQRQLMVAAFWYWGRHILYNIYCYNVLNERNGHHWMGTRQVRGHWYHGMYSFFMSVPTETDNGKHWNILRPMARIYIHTHTYIDRSCVCVCCWCWSGWRRFPFQQLTNPPTDRPTDWQWKAMTWRECCRDSRAAVLTLSAALVFDGILQTRQLLPRQSTIGHKNTTVWPYIWRLFFLSHTHTTFGSQWCFRYL